MGAGALLAVALLHGHLLWVLTVVFLAGLAVGRAWGLLGRLLRSAPRRALAWRGLSGPGGWKVW